MGLSRHQPRVMCHVFCRVLPGKMQVVPTKSRVRGIKKKKEKKRLFLKTNGIFKPIEGFFFADA